MYSNLSDAWVNDSAKEIGKKLNRFETESEISLNTLDPFIQNDLSLSSFSASNCESTWAHIKSCPKCQLKVQEMIDTRLDRLMLENKLSKTREINNQFPWKDAAMIGIGSAVVVLLFLLVLRQK